MAERKVTVRLRMVAREYVAGADESARMTRQLADMQRQLAGTSRRAGVELDRAARQAETYSRRVEAAGRRSGRGMLYAAAGVAALGAAGGGLKILPGLLGATAAAGAALPPMLLGAAAAGGTLVASMRGVGQAIGEVLAQPDPFDALSQSGRALVAEVRALQPEMGALRRELQDRALAGAAQSLRMVATEAVPQVRGSLVQMAAAWDGTLTQMARAVSSPQFAAAFRSAAAGATWFLESINARVPDTVRALSTLVRAADPLARSIGQALVNSIDRFNSAITRAHQAGTLSEFFADASGGAAAFLAIMRDVLALTGIMVREVQAQGGTLADTAAALDRYLASGRAAADMAGIVRTLTAAYEGLRDVLGPLAGMARDALADPATVDAIRLLFEVLRAGVGVLQILFDLFSALPDPVQSLIVAGAALALVVSRLSKSMTVLQASAGRAAAALAATGAAGTRASRGLQAAAQGAGKAAAALVGLQIAGTVLDHFDGSATDVQALGRAIEDFAADGRVAGELARVFGDDLERMGQAARGAADRWFPNLGRSIEQILPPVKNINEMIYGGSFTSSLERFKALDMELAAFARQSKNLTAAQELWNRAFHASGLTIEEFAELVPSSTEELRRLQAAAHGSAAGMQDQSERAKLLAGSFQAAALAGKDLAATMDLINGANVSAVEGQIRLESAYDAAAEAVAQYGRVTRKGTHEIDLSTEAGRASMQTLIEIQQAAAAAAAAEEKRTGNTAAGIPILLAARARFVDLAAAMTGSGKAAVELADKLFAIPDRDIAVDADTEAAIAELRAFGFEVKQLPDGKWVIVRAKTDEAKRRLAEAKAAIDRINDKTVTVTVRQRIELPSGDYRLPGGRLSKYAAGGLSVPYGRPIAAAMGLVRPDIYPASNPPLYQFAEPETGGELFLPRRGIDRQRGRALLAIAASWYGGIFVPVTPMASGGVRAAASGLVTAASGLVSTAPAGMSQATRLDNAQAYLRAREAVAALSRALQENGRSFSHATQKGRENRAAVYAAIEAAQQAARVKYEETGSVTAANRAYDDHINRLKATLRQQKINAATINELMKLAQRPVFVAADSQANIAFAKADIAARGGLESLIDALSLQRAGLDVRTEHGRANLAAIIGYLEQAASAAQARYEQTRSTATATAYYEELVAGLRQALSRAGYTTTVINDLVGTYGRITLRRNARGGVYPAAAGGIGVLGTAGIYPVTGRALYAFAEPGTGGELFLPRVGERARAERLLAVGAGWYGGRYVPAGGGGGGGTTVHNTLTVNTRDGTRLTAAELRSLLRQLDIEARVGRRK